jgi:transglycosylase-like protein
MERTLLKRGGLAIGVLAMAAVPVLGSIDAGAGTSSQAAPSADTVQSHPLGFQAEREAQATFLNTAAWNEAVAKAQAAVVTHRGGGRGGSCTEAQIIARESRGDPTAVNSSSGAGGLYQILPSTWSGRYGVSNAAQATPEQQQQAYTEIRASNPRAWASSGC